MARLMLWAMLLMALAFWSYTVAIVLYRVRTLILQRERDSHWLRSWFEHTQSAKAQGS
jgi:heme exporter protein C